MLEPRRCMPAAEYLPDQRSRIFWSNWGRAWGILLERQWILTAPPLSLELFPETKPINLPDFLSLNQPSLFRGHCLANPYTQDTWGRSAGWPGLPRSLLHTLKTPSTLPLAAVVPGTQPPDHGVLPGIKGLNWTFPAPGPFWASSAT